MSKRVGIVGGGPAGSSIALALVRHGIDPNDLVILDKARFPRPKLCGGGITHRGTSMIAELLGGMPEGGATTVGLEFRSAIGRFPVREVGPQWVFDRGLLDDLLLDRARAAGVEVREGVKVLGARPTSEGWRVDYEGGGESFRWLVGADGATSLIRREAGLPGGILGRLVEAVYEPMGEADPNTLVFDFDPVLEGIPGYAWIFPYPKPGSAGRYKLGIMDGRGVVPGDRLREFTARFAERNDFRLLEPKIAGWPEHYFSFSAKSHRPGLLLTGEAFGIDPLLGEGITPSLEISAYAGARLANAIRSGSDTIPRYELDFVLSSHGRNLFYQAVLANRLYGRHPNRWMRVLFENRAIRELAGRGDFLYGRLSGKSASLGWAFFVEFLRNGFPSSAPLTLAADVAERKS